MAALLAFGASLGEQVGRKEALGQVVDAPVAVAPGQPEDAGLGERLEDRADLVGRAPVPVDGGPRLDVGRGERSVLADPAEELLDQRAVVAEGRRLVVQRGSGPS